MSPTRISRHADPRSRLHSNIIGHLYEAAFHLHPDHAGNLNGAEGARCLAEVLGQCSSLATLDLSYNDIGAEGARSLAGVLGQCSWLARLCLDDNRIHDHVIALVQGCIPSTAYLYASEQGFGEPEDDEIMQYSRCKFAARSCESCPTNHPRPRRTNPPYCLPFHPPSPCFASLELYPRARREQKAHLPDPRL